MESAGTAYFGYAVPTIRLEEWFVGSRPRWREHEPTHDPARSASGNGAWAGVILRRLTSGRGCAALRSACRTGRRVARRSGHPPAGRRRRWCRRRIAHRVDAVVGGVLGTILHIRVLRDRPAIHMKTPRYLRTRQPLPVESPDILHNGHRYRHDPFLPSTGRRQPAESTRIATREYTGGGTDASHITGKR